MIYDIAMHSRYYKKRNFFVMWARQEGSSCMTNLRNKEKLTMFDFLHFGQTKKSTVWLKLQRV
jgi:hypothetical protein